MLCSIEEIFLKKGEQSCLTMITHMLHGVHGADTINVDVFLVRFALAHLNLISIHPSPLLSSS